MDDQAYIELGLNGEADLKVILCGGVEKQETGKLGVVSLVYATYNKETARKKLEDLIANNPNNYYMVYSLPLDTDLTQLAHYPSIAISREDLE